jgi:hypothetical protein
MNKHIELVKKWLADNDSVTQEELRANAGSAVDAAGAADVAADAAYAAANAAAYYATYAAYYAADFAYYGANDARVARYWVKHYEELTK